MVTLVLIEAVLLNGAISGAIYALLALGFTLIYGVSGLVNMSHGSFFMIGPYAFFILDSLFFSLFPILGLSFSRLWITVFALIVATILTGIVGSAAYRLTMHYVIGDDVAVLVVTVALALIFQQLILMGYGPSWVYVPTFLRESIVILGVTMTQSRLLAFAVSIVLFLSLWLFISRSKIGKAMRALSQDREAAMLMGINTGRLYMLTIAISAAFAALAGMFISASGPGVANPFIWLEPLALSFAIVVLGGLGSIKGTLIGGFIIGYATSAVETLVPQGGTIVSAVPFTIMVLILFLRPKGLFGKRIEMEA